jgi:dTDP-glucose 4,6-dehydratase
MRILVTGGAGFIGSHYVRSLLSGTYDRDPDHRVTVLDKLTYAGNLDNLPTADDRLDVVQGDICDPGLVAEVLPGHDAVVHFAAESHVDRSIQGSGEFVRTNVLGTQTLLEASRNATIGRFVHVSTDEVYGSIRSGAWTESRPLLPNSGYAASKAGADLLARSYWRTHRLDLSVTRCSNNYGPRQHPEKVIPRFITKLLQGQPVPLYGDGRNSREWIHVHDHCRAIQLVLTKGRAGEIYNISGADELTNLALTERILALCGADSSMIERVADRKGHDLRYSLDGTKIREELGYVPSIDFAEGLAATVSWYRDNVHWWREWAAGSEPDIHGRTAPDASSFTT